MPELVIKIPKTSDITVFNSCKRICKRFNTPVVTVVALNDMPLGNIPVDGSDSIVWNKVIEYDSCLLKTIAFSIDNLHITYRRISASSDPNVNPLYDEVRIVDNTNGILSPPAEDRLWIIKAINDDLLRMDQKFIDSAAIGAADPSVIAIHHQTLERLERLNEDLIRTTNEFRLEIESESSKKIKDLENDHFEKSRALETEHQKKIQELEEKERELKVRSKLLDDRNNTHARREIRNTNQIPW